MTDQELIQALRTHLEAARKIGLYPGKSGIWAVIEQAADRLDNQNTHIAALQKAIEDLRRQMPRWIPVTERLPKDRSDVLVVAYWHERWGVYMGWCAPERAEWSVHIGIGDRNDVAVTHWMPLPEPPEVEK